jgi:predicted XRE-type DNA-binding protein
MKPTDISYTKGHDNIYQDLGFVDAEERLAKAKLAMHINEIIQERQLKQLEAARLLGINQPKISALVNGRLSGFSMERLLGFLKCLNRDVDIVIKRKRSHRLPGKLNIAFC